MEKFIGNTPLAKIDYSYKGKKQSIYAKLEWYNLSGSIKDRVAEKIIVESRKSGALMPGQEIVETTSGNMGISLSSIASRYNHKVVIFMPKNMSEERQDLLKLYGAELHLTENFDEAFSEAERYALENNAFMSKQFENIYNKMAHLETAKEIAEKVTPKAVVAGVGTSGTLMGLGEFFKEKYDAKVIAVEPKESKLLSSGFAHAKHQLQGLADERVPKLYNSNLVDKIVGVTDEDAIAVAQKLAKELGLGVGISSGANFVGCILSGEEDCATVFADDNKKYLSTVLASPLETELSKEIELEGYEIL